MADAQHSAGIVVPARPPFAKGQGRDPEKIKAKRRRHYLKYSERIKARISRSRSPEENRRRVYASREKAGNYESRLHSRVSEYAKKGLEYWPTGCRVETSRSGHEWEARRAWRWWLSTGAPPMWLDQYEKSKRRHRYSTDPRFRLYSRLKRWMQKHLREKGGDSKKWSAALGYTVGELKQHLESRFLPGMSWVNAGEWHIDHIRPVNTFTFNSPRDHQFMQCYALNNLRPLWAIDNLRRPRDGSDICQ
jgi:hypothetical protein